MAPVRVIFLICNYELDRKYRCIHCKKSRPLRLLDIKFYCNQVIRHVMDSLSLLESLFASVENFYGFLQWNFLITSEASGRRQLPRIDNWLDLSSASVSLLSERIKASLTAHSCCSKESVRDEVSGLRLMEPFNWNEISQCLRECLLRPRWSNSLNCTPRPRSMRSLMHACRAGDGRASLVSTEKAPVLLSNHVVLLGGLPGCESVFNSKYAVERLLKKTLLIDNVDQCLLRGAASVIVDGNDMSQCDRATILKAKSASIQRFIDNVTLLFSKHQIQLSVAAIPEARGVVVTREHAPWAAVVDAFIQRVTPMGRFYHCAKRHAQMLTRSKFACDAHNIGLFSESCFAAVLRPLADQLCSGVQYRQLAFEYGKRHFKASCISSSYGDIRLQRIFFNEAEEMGHQGSRFCLFLKDLYPVSRSAILNCVFNKCSPLCIGKVEGDRCLQVANGTRYFVAELVGKRVSEGDSQVRANCSDESGEEDDPTCQVILNIMPNSQYITLSSVDRRMDARVGRGNGIQATDCSLGEPLADPYRTWATRIKAFKGQVYPVVPLKFVKRPLRSNWRESLVPTYSHQDFVPKRQNEHCDLRIKRKKGSLLVKKSSDYSTADGPVSQYRSYFRNMLQGRLDETELAFCDEIQRILLEGDVSLGQFISDSGLWHNPSDYAACAEALLAKRADICDKRAEEEVMKILQRAMLFQFETALIVGQMHNAKTPPMAVKSQDDIDITSSCAVGDREENSVADNVFEIVNFLRWMLTRYPEAGARASSLLEKHCSASYRFACSVHAEMYRDGDNCSSTPSRSTKAQKRSMPLCDITSSAQPLPAKRQSLPVKESNSKSIVKQYKKYASRFSGSFSACPIRVVKMTSEEWSASNDEFFVPATPDPSLVLSTVNGDGKPSSDGVGDRGGENKENDDQVNKFCLAATPMKPTRYASGFTEEELSEKKARSEQRAAGRVLKYQAKLDKIRKMMGQYKHPSIRHIMFEKELRYQRKVNVLTNYVNVKRQLFPEYGMWCSSESSKTSSENE